MSGYTSPIFGSIDFTPWSPPPIDIFQYYDIVTNDKSHIKKNSAGQVYAGDIFVNTTSHGLGYSGVTGSWYGMQLEDFLSQATVESNSDNPMCIFAMPRSYGNFSNTARTARNSVDAWAVEKYHENPSYNYYVLKKSNGASVTAKLNVNLNGRWGKFVQKINVGRANDNNAPFLEEPIQSTIYNNSPLFVTDADQVWSTSDFAGLQWMLNNAMIAFNNNTSSNSFDTSIKAFSPTDLTRLGALFGEWAALENSVFSNVVWVKGLDGSFLWNRTNQIGCNIITGFPVFSLDSFDQMVKYFQGEPYIADNDNAPDDWSTKWDIYIKGAQKPDIFITMKSDVVDKWLASDANMSGISKGDIKVEYRYPNYGDPTGAQPAPVNILYPSDPVFIDWLKDSYDVSRETSYAEILSLNYNLVEQIILANEFREGDVIQYQYYAQLYFRIAYGTYRSAWCRFKIGFIGSPTVPDFSQMENEGVQDDEVFFDYSTVTLHYDEFPPNYNPYPDVPLPDMPVPGGTEPTPVPPGLNGIGLLSTTYKVTIENARALGRFFWGGDLFQKIKALNTSPIENVVGMTIMPIDITGTTSVITIGDVNTTINGDKITSVPLYTVGSVEIKGRYQSFMDFEPYTSAFIFLPFVGFVQIDPVYFTNKTLSVIYSYDLIAGLCNAMLFSEGIYVESHQGTCGIDVPLIASNRAELAIGLATSLVTSAALPASAALSGGKNVAKNVARSGLSGAVEGAGGIVDFITGFHSTRQGGYSPACAWTETRECFIVIESANGAHTSSYNHDKGRPCNATYSIGALKGFTIVDPSVDLSGITGATEEEIAMIREYLTTGFYA